MTPRKGPPTSQHALLALASLLPFAVTQVQASVYIDAPFAERVFDSVAYFDFEDTRWPYVGGGDMLIGPINLLTASSFDEYFIEYQEEPPTQQKNATQPLVAPHSADPSSEYQMTTPPNFLIVEYGGSPYSQSLENIRHVAEWSGADFVLLIANRHASWQERFEFWWNHKFPGLAKGLLERDEDIAASKGVQCSFLAIGPRQGACK